MTKARDTANIVGGGFSGTITGATLAATTGVTFPDGSIPLVDLDIDGGTDIGAALVDADLMIVDDGAGGTNRKATMSRLATYMGTKIGGGMEFIASSGAISNAASVAFTGFDSSKYDAYKFIHHYIIPATDNVYFTWNSSTDGGSSYDTTSGHYIYGNDGNSGSVGYGYISAYNQIGSDTNEFGIIGQSILYSPHNTSTYKLLKSDVAYFHTNGQLKQYAMEYGNAYRAATADIDAIRFQMSSGNIESGEITMFGIVNS